MSLCSPKACKSFVSLEKICRKLSLLGAVFQMNPTLIAISGDLSIYF